MAEIKHTPGPWTSGPPNQHATCCAWDDQGRLIAEVGANIGPDIERARGNARLIAAAPEMLEALKAQEDLQQRGILNMTDAEVERVSLLRRAAIAKAEGQANG